MVATSGRRTHDAGGVPLLTALESSVFLLASLRILHIRTRAHPSGCAYS